MTKLVSDQEPGTMVWVGNSTHPEFSDAFRFCRQQVAQLAIRRSPRELVDRPAGFVKRILFVRPDRRPLSVALHTSIIERYREAKFLSLSSALCDGESRTGNPWPGMRNLRFSRWRELLPNWIEPCGYRHPHESAVGAVVVICDRYEMAEPYLDIASSLGHTVLWKRTHNIVAVRNIAHVIWDDSIASPAAAEVWRQRIGHREINSATKHTWLVTQPHAAEINAAIAGGVSVVLTKPVVIDRLFEPTIEPANDSQFTTCYG